MNVFSFEAFEQLGSQKPSPANPPQPEDLCTIMYTSGTTDKPKVHSCMPMHAINQLLFPGHFPIMQLPSSVTNYLFALRT